MELYFGVAADGRTYPDAPSSAGALDAAVVGPAGLVAFLESQLGLAGPPVPRAVRIAAYLAKLRAASSNGRFWCRSFEKDPWSTAATLLAWRDGLVSAGWTRGSVGSARVDDLAAAEAAAPPIPPGLPDRAVALLAAIPSRPGMRLCRLVLLEPRASLPPLWARLVDALETRGAEVHVHEGNAPASEGSDLRRVQDAVAGGGVQSLQGDGTFVMLQADTALMAAEAVADWLAAGPSEALEGTVVVAPDGDTALLDRALRARGLPALGLSAPSPWRGALQVLPLAFAVSWAPLNAKALLNLLMLPRPPIPRFVAGRLARALASEPGVDGRAWEAAWAAIAERARERAKSSAQDAPGAVEAQVARWRAWTAAARFDRTAGMPLAEARLIAGRVSAWAMQADAGAGDPLLLGAASAAGNLIEALEELGLELLPALLLDRVIAQVLADGVTNPAHTAEAGGLRAVRAPGALWGPARRVIWWNFVGPGQRTPVHPWSGAELAILEGAGTRVESAARASSQIAASYASVLQHAAERLILVRPALSRADQTVTHPLAHQLRPILEGAVERVSFRAERLLREPEVRLAGRVLHRLPRATVDTPLGRPAWALPAPAVAKLNGRRESPTSLGRLMHCQMAWLVRDVLDLRPGAFAQIPGPDQLFGTLAHEIVRRLMPAGLPPALAGVRETAAALFEELLPQMAAPLQQPEHAAELAAAREMVPAALEALVRLLHEKGLEVVGVELDREGQVGGLALQGRLDLLVRKGTTSAVIDLKWTRSERRYRDEVLEGRAIQLAVYHGIAGGPGEVGDGGYFLLRQRRVLAPVGSILADDPLEAVRGDSQTLQVVTADWSLWRALAEGGIALAAGVDGSADQRPLDLGFAASDQPCRFCDLTGLCRIHVETL